MMVKKCLVKMIVGSLALLICGCATMLEQSGGPFQASGIKICEVDTDSAIIWTRLTRNPERMGPNSPMPEVKYRDAETGKLYERGQKGSRPDMAPVVKFPDGATIGTLQGACPGAPGQVRIRYSLNGTSRWDETAWSSVDPRRDFTHQFKITALKPGSSYDIRVECRSNGGASNGQTVEGRFKTAPLADLQSRVVFTVSTGQGYPDQDAPGGGYKIYDQMLKLDPDFFVHTGDIVYYDRDAKTIDLARLNWIRMFSLPTNVRFHRQVSSYFIKDDHDAWMNDCWPTRDTKFMGEFTFQQGLGVFLEQVGMGESTYRRYRWGKDLEIWMVEGRDFRSPNDMTDGPEKTIWGKEQKAWFKRTVQESDAAFRILISPTPIVGPDRDSKKDNHSNKPFTHEGDEIREFIKGQKNMVVMCGDRHWQYISVHPETGIWEFSSGPASNGHAGGWKQEDFRPDYHRYLNVTGGFMAATVERVNGTPTLTVRHHSVDGQVLNEQLIVAK